VVVEDGTHVAGERPVLADVVELVRQLMEARALRRVEEGALTDDQVEGLGLDLLHLERRGRAQGPLRPHHRRPQHRAGQLGTLVSD
jgi:hypothetical protein